MIDGNFPVYQAKTVNHKGLYINKIKSARKLTNVTGYEGPSVTNCCSFKSTRKFVPITVHERHVTTSFYSIFSAKKCSHVTGQHVLLIKID